MEDQIVRMVCRIIVPFIQVFGMFIIIFGHLSPGGGFAGGAIAGASMVLFALSFNLEEGSKKLKEETASALESGGALVFAFMGLIAVLLGGNYLTNLAAGFPAGTAGDLLSGGAIPVITLGLGIKVTSSIITLFYHLIGGEEAEEHGNSGESTG